MKTPEQYYNQAREIFFSAHADFQAALEQITEKDARESEMTLQQLRALHAERIYAAFIRQKQLDGIIFSIQLVETDNEVAAQAIESYLRGHAKALGMTWEEFCEKNHL